MRPIALKLLLLGSAACTGHAPPRRQRALRCFGDEFRRPAQCHDDAPAATRALMRACTVATMLAAVFVQSGCARPADNARGVGRDGASIVGNYSMQVTARDNPSWRGMIGDWDFEFRGDGRLIAHQSGGMRMSIDMAYRFEAGVLTINDLAGNGSCRHFGVDSASAAYRVRFLDSGFEALPLRDECTPRVYGMTLHNFTRVDR